MKALFSKLGEKKIDFFVVGAPKCGTTSLFSYLREHPDIFLPSLIASDKAGKIEPSYFATDLLAENNPFNKQDNYETLYQGANPSVIWGDISVNHLFSKDAARNIYKYNKNSKIIIMLRNPVDFLYSYYYEMSSSGAEQASNFTEALEKSKDNNYSDPAHRFTKGSYMNRSILNYWEVAKFSTQIDRYQQLFPRDNILFVRFDEFIKNTTESYAEICCFLGVPSINPEKFEVINATKQPRITKIRDLTRKPPNSFRFLAKILLNKNMRFRIRQTILELEKRYNTIRSYKKPMDEKLRKKLVQEFSTEVKRIESITGWDLNAWLR